MRYVLLLYGGSLGLTLLIEIPVCLCFGLRGKDQLLLVLLTNLLTNPAAVWLHTSLGLPQVSIEILVVIIEYYVYRSFRDSHHIPNPFTLALTANGISWGLGLLLQTL